MTISDVIAYLDAMKPNDYTPDDKVGWLNIVDTIVFQQIFTNYEDSEVTSAPKYDASEAESTELLVPEPFAEDVYFHFLAAKIDLFNKEYSSYNNEISLYNAAMESFRDHYNSTHTHKQTKQKYF